MLFGVVFGSFFMLPSYFPRISDREIAFHAEFLKAEVGYHMTNWREKPFYNVFTLECCSSI